MKYPFHLVCLTALIAVIPAGAVAQKTETITIITRQENRLKGLLICCTDSSITVFPGKRKDLKKDKKPAPLVLMAHRIRSIRHRGNWMDTPSALQTISSNQ